MSKQNCLDNPSKPSKLFRDVLRQRRKAETTVLRQKLTPQLVAAWDEYKNGSGRAMSAATANECRAELGGALERALDGELDLDAQVCAYCAFVSKEKEKRAAAIASGQARTDKSPSGAHLLFCRNNQRQGQERAAAVESMRAELERIHRLAIDALRRQQQAGDASGVVSIAWRDGDRSPGVAFTQYNEMTPTTVVAASASACAATTSSSTSGSAVAPPLRWHPLFESAAAASSSNTTLAISGGGGSSAMVVSGSTSQAAGSSSSHAALEAAAAPPLADSAALRARLDVEMAKQEAEGLEGRWQQGSPCGLQACAAAEARGVVAAAAAW